MNWTMLKAGVRGEGALTLMGRPLSNAEDPLAGELADAQRREAKSLRRLELLGRANSALRRVANGLAGEPDIEMFLGNALRAFVEAFDGMGGTFWWWTSEELRLAFEFRGGELWKPERSQHPDDHRSPHRLNAQAANVERRQHNGEIVVLRVSQPEGWMTGTREFLHSLGVGTLICVPLNVGDQHLGRFTIRLSEERGLEPEEYELAEALATQAATAMALTKLSNETREAAIAREREVAARQKAEALARTNSTVRATLDKLAERQDLGAFLSETLVVCARELDAIGAGIWVRNGSHNDLIVSLEDGEVRNLPTVKHPGVKPEFKVHGRSVILSKDQIRIESGDMLRSAPWYPAARGYFESRGIVAIASVPLFIGDTWMGTIVLRHAAEPVYEEEKRELAFALANQVALALELMRLGEAAKDEAVAREREAAATARAAKLAQANAALRSTIESLRTTDDLDVLLGNTLKAIADQIKAKSATVWLMDWNAGLSHLKFVIEDGQVVPARESKHPNAHSPYVIHESSALQNYGTRRARPSVNVVATHPGFTNAQRDYLHSLGCQALLDVPMVLGDEQLGTFTARLESKKYPLTEDLELIQALADQATLAVQLKRLADLDKAAAVALEREAAAVARAAKLAQANAALRATIESLKTTDDLDALLGNTLKAIADQIHVRSATVWLLDCKANLSHLKFVMEEGRVLPARYSKHPNAKSPAVLDASRIDRYGTGLARPFVLPVASDPELTDAHREYLLRLGCQALLSVPMMLGKEHIGSFTARLESEVYPLAEDLELIQALADQATLAVQLKRLADSDKTAAVTREREAAATARAAKLAQANAALRATIETLRTADDLDVLLGNTLKSIADQIHANSATVWLYDWNASLCHLKFVVEDGRILPAGESKHPNANMPHVVTEEDLSHIQGYGSGRAKAVVHPIATASLTSTQRDHLFAIGCKALLSVPMTLGNEHIGTFTARLESEEYPIAEDLELIQALADQATLAVQLKRLADSDKAAAISGEQAIAASQRSAILERTNETLRHSLDLLADDSVITRFLGHVLRAVTEGLDVPHSTLWIFDESTGMNTLHMICSGGQVRDAEADSGGLRLSLSTTEWAPWRRMVSSRQPLVFLDAQNHPDLIAQRDWMRREGVRTLLITPLMMGERVLGTFGIHNIARDVWTEEEINLARAMAHQATVALQLTRLAQAAEETAVHREREAAARTRYETLHRTNSLLRESLRSLAGEPDLEDFLGELLKVLIQALGASEGSIWVHDPGRNLDALQVTLGSDGNIFGSADAHPLRQLQPAIVNSDLTGAMRERRVALNHEDSFGEPRFAPFLGYLTDRGIRSVASVPMFLGDRYRGAITLRFTQHRDIDTDDEQLAMAFAHQAALAIQMNELAERARRAAVVEERNRMAQEIHDTLAQGFATIGMRLSTAEREAMTGTQQATKDHIAAARELARSNLFEARRSMRALQSPNVPSGGLEGALRRLTDQVQLGTSARIDLSIEPSIPVLPRSVEDELLRVVGEALNNAVKHAEATHVTVSLRAPAGTGVQFRVTDDGRGFDPDLATAGYGLNGMQTRAARIGATLTIVTDPGSGTDVIGVWAPQEKS